MQTFLMAYKLRQTTQDPQRPYPLPIHLPTMAEDTTPICN
jgi:hypothetical protein